MLRLVASLKKMKQTVLYNIESVMALYSHNYGFKKDEYVYGQSYSDNEIQNELGECLIVMFDGRQIHCGLTDRFKGICTAYEFSKEFGLKFYINYNYPFELTDYLLPNQYDWRVDRTKVLYNKNTSVPVFLNDWQSNTFFHQRYLKEVIKRNSGKQIHLYINSPFHIDKYRLNYNVLFKPSSTLQQAINQQLHFLGSNYVAMSFRFLQLLGDFREEHAPFPILSDEEQNKLIKSCEDKVMALRKKYNIHSRILLTADSVKFLSYMQKHHDFVYVIPGAIAHIDNEGNDNNAIYMKTFLDMYMLSKAKCIYQLCTGEMYKNSAFAKQAAFLGGVEYIKIEF